MDQTAQDRLTALAETYKQQMFKLPKPQVEEAASILAQGLLGDLGQTQDILDTSYEPAAPLTGAGLSRATVVRKPNAQAIR